MGGDWVRRKIGSFGRVVTGKTPSTKDPNNFGGKYPFITIPDLNGRVWIDQTARTLSEQGARSIRTSMLPAGAVLMSCIATVGKCGITTAPSFTNQQINSVIPGPEVDSLFLYYVFTQLGHELEAAGGGGSVYTNVSKSRFSEIEVTIPSDLSEQRAIARILGSLDEKIELNRRINETLEAMAQALFKSWFVDFDPVVVNAIKAGNPIPEKFAKRAAHYRENPDSLGLPDDILRLFPDRFVDSELGPIPEGWEVKALKSIATTTIGGQWGSDKYKKGLVPVVCIRGKDMEELRTLGYATSVPIRFVKENAIIKRLLNDNEVLIAGSGEGPCGRPMWCSSMLNEIFDYPVIYSNFVKRLETPSAAHAMYVDLFLYLKFLDGSIRDYFTGTSVPNLDLAGLLNQVLVLLPTEDILKMFSRFYTKYIEHLLSIENKTLMSLRDMLLPKLISGELRVPEVEKILENVI